MNVQFDMGMMGKWYFLAGSSSLLASCQLILFRSSACLVLPMLVPLLDSIRLSGVQGQSGIHVDYLLGFVQFCRQCRICLSSISPASAHL